jgi:hypothetical protein
MDNQRTPKELQMTRNSYQFASVDLVRYIDGLATMVRHYVKQGYEPYILTFQFRSLPDSDQASKDAMAREVERVYARFLTEVVRNPWSERNANSRPVFIGCPDWPVHKKKHRRLFTDAQSGIHFAGILLLPPFNRLKAGVKHHFQDKRSAYIRRPHRLSSIHVEHVDTDVEKVVEYSFKALKHRRCHFDDIMVLPKSRSERKAA